MILLTWLMHRIWGGVVAVLLFILPSLFLLILLSWIYLAYGHVPAVIMPNIAKFRYGGGFPHYAMPKCRSTKRCCPIYPTVLGSSFSGEI